MALPLLCEILFCTVLDWRLFDWANGHASACLVDDGRATCFDNPHWCLVDFHQRFPVGGHVQSASPVYSALVWRHVHPVGPLCQFWCVTAVLTERLPLAVGSFFQHEDRVVKVCLYLSQLMISRRSDRFLD